MNKMTQNTGESSNGTLTNGGEFVNVSCFLNIGANGLVLGEVALCVGFVCWKAIFYQTN